MPLGRRSALCKPVSVLNSNQNTAPHNLCVSSRSRALAPRCPRAPESTLRLAACTRLRPHGNPQLRAFRLIPLHWRLACCHLGACVLTHRTPWARAASMHPTVQRWPCTTPHTRTIAALLPTARGWAASYIAFPFLALCAKPLPLEGPPTVTPRAFFAAAWRQCAQSPDVGSSRAAGVGAIGAGERIHSACIRARAREHSSWGAEC